MSGVSSAGLSTTVLPAASAGATFHEAIVSGKFQGVIRPTTPRGSRIQETLDRRQHAIEESIDVAARTREEAEELLAEYRERLAAAREQAEEILSRARKAGEAAEAAAISDAKAKREELLEQTKREIQAETRRAIQDIRNEVADLTILATQKVTRKTLTEEDQRVLIEER